MPNLGSVAALIAATVSGPKPPHPPPARPVRTVTVGRVAEGETVSLTGHVRAKNQVSLAFRLDGRMIERPVNVGDVLTAGQIVAKLDVQIQQNTLRSAQGDLSSLQAQLVDARLTFGRQQALVKEAATPRARFDEARQKLESIQSQVDAAQAQVRIAEEELSYTVLFADAPGAVTAVGAEPGELVRAGQMVVQLAREGGRDAVFDVPEQLNRTGPRDPLVQIALTNDPTVRATGRVREVAPQADATTRTFQVKVGIIDPPQGMELGSTVTGRIKLPAPPGVESRERSPRRTDARPCGWSIRTARR
jgi:RND family efflux transporter MFP subunit